MSKKSLSQTKDDESVSEARVQVPEEIEWHMIDKSKFFFLNATLSSCLTTALYPAYLLKTRKQVSSAKISFHSIMRYEGLRGCYRGLGTSLMGTIPARALSMSALEVTKSQVGTAFVSLGFSDTNATTIASAAGGVASAVAAQVVWTPVDVVSQRLMVQGSKKVTHDLNKFNSYKNGSDAVRKILHVDGPRGFYRGFGVSLVTYAPSHAVSQALYSMIHRLIWNEIGLVNGYGFRHDDSKAMIAGVQGVSAVMASGISAIITMPLDTIKTRLQVLDVEENGRKRPLTFLQTLRNLVKEGGLLAFYRGFGPRWVSTAMSATTMITTHEFVKRISAKNPDKLTA